MRLLTWNLCRGSLARKLWAVDQVGFDVAVLPEVARPPKITEHALWFGRSPRQGMAVLASPEFSLTELPRREEVPDLVIPIQVHGKWSFRLLAVWTVYQKNYRYIRAASRAIDIYEDLFRAGPVVMLGDFNASKIWDGHHPPDRNFSSVATRLFESGLVSAYHHHRAEAFGQESEATFYLRWNRVNGYHIDYCFLPLAWAKRITRVEVGTFDQWSAVSDHRPLLVEMSEA